MECKTNRGIKDVAEDIVGRIKTGDLQITRFAYADGYKDDLINTNAKYCFILKYESRFENCGLNFEKVKFWPPKGGLYRDLLRIHTAKSSFTPKILKIHYQIFENVLSTTKGLHTH